MTIRLPGATDGVFRLFNITGQLSAEFYWNQEMTVVVNLEQVQSGYYTYFVEDDAGFIRKGKLFVE